MEKDPTLKQILLDYINSTQGWITKGELGIITEKAGYLPESCGRHLRFMAGGATNKYPNHIPEIFVSYYKGKRGQKLSRYARLGEPAPTPPKLIFKEIINEQGQRIMQII